MIRCLRMIKCLWMIRCVCDVNLVFNLNLFGFDLIWFDLIWFDLMWFDLIWFDLMRWDEMRWDEMRWDEMNTSFGFRSFSLLLSCNNMYWENEINITLQWKIKRAIFLHLWYFYLLSIYWFINDRQRYYCSLIMYKLIIH